MAILKCILSKSGNTAIVVAVASMLILALTIGGVFLFSKQYQSAQSNQVTTEVDSQKRPLPSATPDDEVNRALDANASHHVHAVGNAAQAYFISTGGQSLVLSYAPTKGVFGQQALVDAGELKREAEDVQYRSGSCNGKPNDCMVVYAHAHAKKATESAVKIGGATSCILGSDGNTYIVFSASSNNDKTKFGVICKDSLPAPGEIF